MVLDRISTGISGLDSLIEGEVPKGFTVLVAGNPGTGKTILTSHFLYEGLKNGEPAIFCSLEESADEIRRMAENYGYDTKELEKKGLTLLVNRAAKLAGYLARKSAGSSEFAN